MTMGRALSKLSRPIKNFNIENRAEKVIKKRESETFPAPRHPSTDKPMQQFASEHPEYLEAQKVKNHHLLENLKHVYVESHDPVQEEQMTTKSTKTRPLPQNRNQSLEYEFGTVEPSFIPVGKASMKQVMDFVTQHQAQPESYTAKDIALEYNLELVHVQQVLKYFQNYQMYLPKELLKKHPKLLDNLSSQKLNLNEAKKLLGVYTPADEGKS